MKDPILLLDTSIVSLMGRERPPPGLRSWLLRVGIDRLAICYPVIAELLRGAHLREKDNPQKAREVKAWVARILATKFPMPDMDPEVANIYARMTSIPRLKNLWVVQRNQKVARLGHDLMIASVAIAHQTPIVTDNITDFMSIHDEFPLPGIYHPMNTRWYVPPPFEVPLPVFNESESDPHDALLPMM